MGSKKKRKNKGKGKEDDSLGGIANTILDIQPGYLNDFDVDDVDQESIDFQSESGESILRRMQDKIFTPNKFKTSGTLIGILLRTDNKFSGKDCTGQDLAIAVAKPGHAKYKLDTYKVRVPELHFMLPTPKSLPGKTDADKLIIDSYPTMQAIDTLVQRQGAVPGDLVKVELANKGAISRMYFAGPLDPKNTGMSQAEFEKCLEGCRKKYTNGGSVGDCIGKNVNLAKYSEGIPPVVNGEGHTEESVVLGEGGAEWLKKIIEDLKDKFSGKTWIGALEGNGSGTDTVEMIPASKGGGAGRSTLIFLPKGMDPKSDIEIIYFFHHNKMFANEKNPEWEKIGSVLNKMAQKNNKFGGGRRNFVFVMPELLWSKEAISKPDIGYARVQSQNTKFPNSDSAAYRYKDRHWSMWGYDGTIKYPKLDGKAPLSYKSTNSPGPGNIKTFHDNVLKTLASPQFNINSEKITHISLIGDRFGGAAISNAARMNVLGSTFGQKLYKIQLLHSDYSGTPDNMFHDNDLKDIVGSINLSKISLEIHMSTKGDRGVDKLPRDAVAAFIGQTSKTLLDSFKDQPDGNITPEVARDNMLKTYNDKLKWTSDDAKIDVNFKTNYDNGRKFLITNASKTIRLSGPWANIIYKGWSTAPSFEWVSWLADKTTVPTAIAVSDVIKDQGALINLGVPETDEKKFKDYEGNVLLYKSEHSSHDGKTAIVVPPGADVNQPYELIYFLHGFTGASKWADHGWTKSITNHLKTMVHGQKRNVIYVTTQLNVASGNDKKATWSKGDPDKKQFPNFHKEVVEHIMNKEENKGFKGGKPKWIAFKSFSGGYAALAGIVEKLTSSSIHGVPIQRMDYLDSFYGGQVKVLTKIWKDLKLQFKPGEKFELHVYSDKGKSKDPNGTWKTVSKYLLSMGLSPNGFNGNKKIMEGAKEATLSQLDGLWLANTTGGHLQQVTSHFGEESKLKPSISGHSGFSPKKPASNPAGKVDISKIPVSFDKDGNASNYLGQELDDKYDLKDPQLACEKGDVKRHVAKTGKPIVDKKSLKDCETGCRDGLKSGEEPKKPPFKKEDAHPIENLLSGASSDANFKSRDSKRSPGSITTIVLHQGCTGLGGTIRALNSKHLGTHFTVSHAGIKQHVDPERVTAHASSANNRSIGIDITSFCKFDIAKKDADPEKAAKKKGCKSSKQLIKTKLGWKGTQTVGNLSMMENCKKLVAALLKKYPSISKGKFGGASGSNYFFGHGSSGTTGVVPHGYISKNRSDGRYVCLYIYLRLVKGIGPTAAYSKVLNAAWKSGGYPGGTAEGNAAKGKPPKPVRTVSIA